MKNEKKRTIESYVEEAKTDIFIYFFVYGFFIIGIILLAIKLQAIFIYLIILPFICFFINRILVYKKVIRINKYLNTNRLKEVGQNILFWNNDNYFLTEEYFIILNKKVVDVFSYQDIKTIQKEINYYLSSHASHHDYLYIKLNNNNTYKIIIRFNSSHFSLQNAIDISDFFIKKNENIIIEEPIVKVCDKILK